MQNRTGALMLAHVAILLSSMACVAYAHDDNDRRDDDYDSYGRPRHHDEIQVGVRPYYLVEGMDPSPLKDKLLSCEDGPFRRTDFSIAHRGAPLEFPEHTKEAYSAGARMGAGVVECDVTFTSDGN